MAFNDSACELITDFAESFSIISFWALQEPSFGWHIDEIALNFPLWHTNMSNIFAMDTFILSIKCYQLHLAQWMFS